MPLPLLPQAPSVGTAGPPRKGQRIVIFDTDAPRGRVLSKTTRRRA